MTKKSFQNSMDWDDIMLDQQSSNGARSSNWENNFSMPSFNAGQNAKEGNVSNDQNGKALETAHTKQEMSENRRSSDSQVLRKPKGITESTLNTISSASGHNTTCDTKQSSNSRRRSSTVEDPAGSTKHAEKTQKMTVKKENDTESQSPQRKSNEKELTLRRKDRGSNITATDESSAPRPRTSPKKDGSHQQKYDEETKSFNDDDMAPSKSTKQRAQTSTLQSTRRSSRKVNETEESQVSPSNAKSPKDKKQKSCSADTDTEKKREVSSKSRNVTRAIEKESSVRSMSRGQDNKETKREKSRSTKDDDPNEDKQQQQQIKTKSKKDKEMKQGHGYFNRDDNDKDEDESSSPTRDSSRIRGRSQLNAEQLSRSRERSIQRMEARNNWRESQKKVKSVDSNNM
jgi:hypothetical protein